MDFKPWWPPRQQRRGEGTLLPFHGRICGCPAAWVSQRQRPWPQLQENGNLSWVTDLRGDILVRRASKNVMAKVMLPSTSIHSFPHSFPHLHIRSACLRARLLSHARLFATAWTVACQAPLSMGFSKQEYWCVWPFPSPRDLPNSRIKPRSPVLQEDALPS